MKQMTQDDQGATLLHKRYHQSRERESKGQNKIKKTDIWQFLRFCIVGTSNAIIDFGVLNLLLFLYPTSNTWKTLGYNSVAVLLASTNSFFWNKYWTFQQRGSIIFQEIYRFMVIASGTMLMNDTLMWLLDRTLPGIVGSSLLGANILKLGAIIGTMSISFFGMRLWVFFQQRFAEEAQSLTDNKMEKLPGIKLIYDVDTVIVGAIRPAHNVATTIRRERGQSKSSVLASDASTNKFWRNSPMKTLIIIPTYNELENLPLLLKQIFSYAPLTDVLVVDDNSPDGTGELAEEMRKQQPQIHVLHRPGKLGLGTAYIAGFKYAIQYGYDAAFEMDADFSHDPRYLPDFLKAIQHADLVIGSRYIPGGNTPNWSFSRRLISGSGNIFARFLLGIPVHDCTGGFRCYRRQVLQGIDLDTIQSRGYAFQIELTYRVLKQGFRIVETPITFMDRRLGTSKMSRKIVIEAFTYVLRTRFSKQSSVRSVTPLRSDNVSSVIPKPDLQKEQLSSSATQSLSGFGHLSLGSVAVLPFSQPLRQEHSMNSAWSKKPFRVLPSRQWSINLPGQQGFGKQIRNPAMIESPLESNRHITPMVSNTSLQNRPGIVWVEVGKEPGRTYELCKESLSIGRIRESDICLDDPAISRLHASIVSKSDGNYFLIDEGSANGTKVNGQVLNHYQPYLLEEGDKIQLGQIVLVFAKNSF